MDFYFLGIALFLFLTACSTSEFVEDEVGKTATFAHAEMYYYHDNFVEGVGSYGIAMYNGDRSRQFTELYLDFASDHFKDALRAVPAEGTYTYSDDFSMFTFNNAYSSYTESDGVNETKLGILGGKFTLSREGAGYLLRFEVELGDGMTMRGSYEGVISGMYDSTIDSDLDLDFNTMDRKRAEAVGVDPTTWAILLWGECDGENIETILMVHSEDFLPSLPEGNFPMAENIRKGQSGTAEPASAHSKDIHGSYFVDSRGDLSWAVPGEGFVDISKSEDGYLVEFSFEDSNGYTVSGEYTGAINGTFKERVTDTGLVAVAMTNY